MIRFHIGSTRDCDVVFKIERFFFLITSVFGYPSIPFFKL